MSAIIQIVAFLVFSIMLGRHARKPTLLGYITIALVSFVQVAVVFYFILTMEYPTL